MEMKPLIDMIDEMKIFRCPQHRIKKFMNMWYECYSEQLYHDILSLNYLSEEEFDAGYRDVKAFALLILNDWKDAMKAITIGRRDFINRMIEELEYLKRLTVNELYVKYKFDELKMKMYFHYCVGFHEYEEIYRTAAKLRDELCTMYINDSNLITLIQTKFNEFQDLYNYCFMHHK